MLRWSVTVRWAQSKSGLSECGNKHQARLGVKLGGEVEWAGASGCVQGENGTEMCLFGFVPKKIETALNSWLVSCSFGNLACSSVLTSVLLLVSRLANWNATSVRTPGSARSSAACAATPAETPTNWRGTWGPTRVLRPFSLSVRVLRLQCLLTNKYYCVVSYKTFVECVAEENAPHSVSTCKFITWSNYCTEKWAWRILISSWTVRWWNADTSSMTRRKFCL